MNGPGACAVPCPVLCCAVPIVPKRSLDASRSGLGRLLPEGAKGQLSLPPLQMTQERYNGTLAFSQSPAQTPLRGQ